MKDMKTYYVLKGCHYSNFFPCIQCTKDTMTFEHTLVFDESCRYDIDERACVNKLFGFCFGFGVHKNSVRFGWTYEKNKCLISLWRYVYDGGKLSKSVIYRVSVGEKHNYRITAKRSIDGSWNTELLIDEQTMATYYGIVAKACFVTTLGLYFGGNTSAPHTIKVRRLA